MELKALLEGVEIKRVQGDIRKEIEGIAYHSKKVEKGFLFAAIRGMEVDGHRFIREAIERGAGALLLEEDLQEAFRGTTILVPNSRQALARVSKNFYGNPSLRVNLIGITGTNGKTTTTYLLESILMKAGYQVGLIGTIHYRYGQRVARAVNTTPESLDLQRILFEMVNEGISHVVMEVSSHGIDLGRIYGCQFDGAVFTNFSRDHLDYHHTLTRYFETKKRLFSESLMGSKKLKRFAVTNLDDPKGRAIVEGINLPVFSYGMDPACDIFADRVVSTLEGLSCKIHTPKGEFSIESKLIGGFNIYNILAAVATGVAMNIPIEIVKKGVEALEGVAGRFERVGNRGNIHVIVDYAHTPDALERVLLGLKGIMENLPLGTSKDDAKLITVFGCGGDRDRTKRPFMGEAAGRFSDLSILTSDNPRTEDPLAIMEEVEQGFKKLPLEELRPDEIRSWRKKKGYHKIPDRREAIQMAIQLARPSDVVLIAGKGHEDYQIIGKEKFPFSDRAEARKALGEE